MKMPKRVIKFLKKQGKLSVYFAFGYLVTIILGLILYWLAINFQILNQNICVPIKGVQICSLLGLFIFVFSSLPGYIFIGTLLNALFYAVPLWLSYVLVGGTSLMFYFLVGKYFDLLVAARNSSKEMTKLIVYGFFVTLAVIVVVLKLVDIPIP